MHEILHPCCVCLLSTMYSRHAEKFEERPEFNLHETHFDHITKPAPGMTVLGFSENTPVQMCCVGDHFLGEGKTCLIHETPQGGAWWSMVNLQA